MRSIFEISTRGMISARSATEITSNNIANANTPGYSRQAPVLTEHVQKSGNGSKGLGVNVSQMERLRNELIDQQINRKEHEIGELSEKASIYRLMETSLISSDGSGLDTAISGFFNAFSDLSANPQDLNLRNTLISKSEQMTQTFHTLDKDLRAFGEQALEGARIKLERVNELLEDIATMNREISRSRSGGQEDNNALDRKTAALNELSKLVEFDEVTNTHGTTEIRIGGISVVSGQEASALKAEVDEAGQTFRVRLPGGKIVDAARGELSANIHMFEEGVPEARQQLDAIASAIIDRVNDIHSNGYGLFDGTQRDFFAGSSANARNIQVSQQLIDNPGHIAASSAQGEAGNNDRAIEIARLQDERFIDGQTVGTKAVQFMGLAGSKLNEIENKLESGTAARDFLTNRQEQLSGVNIDEELGNLIRFQNSFQASARVLDTGRKMYDTLLSLA